MRETRSFSQIFADFRFSWELQHFGGADFRRKPQETADFRRKPQETADFCRNPFVPFSSSLLVPPYLVSEQNMQQREGTKMRGHNSEIPPVLLGIPWPALRGPLRNQFWKKRRPQPYWGGENSGNALEASNALNYRFWGIPDVLSREIPGNALRAFPGSFRNFSGISPGKSQPYWGYGPITVLNSLLSHERHFYIMHSYYWRHSLGFLPLSSISWHNRSKHKLSLVVDTAWLSPPTCISQALSAWTLGGGSYNNVFLLNSGHFASTSPWPSAFPFTCVCQLWARTFRDDLPEQVLRGIVIASLLLQTSSRHTLLGRAIHGPIQSRGKLWRTLRPFVHTNCPENKAKAPLVHASFPWNSYGPMAAKSLW